MTAIAGGVGCALPMFRTLGYEYSLLISLVASAGAGHLAACYPHRVRSAGLEAPGPSAISLYLKAWLLALALLVIPLALALLNRFRVQPCNEVEGLLFYLLMPVCSTAAAAAFGLLAGLITKRAFTASLLWLAFFIASLVGAFYSFYSSPAVFVFGPLFGYFPGVLYDELVSVDARLVTYRIATLAQTAAAVSFSSWLMNPATLKLSLKRLWKSPRTAATTGAFIIVAVGMYFAGPSLGHRTERADLEDLLSRKMHIGRLDLFFPSGTDSRSMNALADDAVFGLNQVEQYLGVTSKKRIAVFFFSGRSQKARAMGAAKTNVAKPWRSEVYVTMREPPHEVLRHELVHAVAAELGSGPFAVPGTFGGLVPDPGRIEGLAVAAQGPRGDLTIHQWAAAMKRLELLPELNKIFSFGFFNLAASAAYTAAGSFCSWVHDTFGPKALTEAYRTGDWKKATERGLEDLEKSWLESLDRVPLRDEDLAAASHRFDRPAVIHSVCVHEVARLREKARRLSDSGHWGRAERVYQEAHRKSGGATSTRLSLFYILLDSGKVDEARKEAASLLEAPEINSVTKAAVEEIVTDLDLAEGRSVDASAIFERLATGARNEADRRRLQVKARLANCRDSGVKRILGALARRPGPRAVPQNLAALAIAESACARPGDPVLSYLVARQHFNLRDWGVAISWLDKAEAEGLAGTTSSLHFEARMLKARCMFSTGRYKEAKALFGLIASDGSVRLGSRALAKDWEERSDFKAGGG